MTAEQWARYQRIADLMRVTDIVYANSGPSLYMPEIRSKRRSAPAGDDHPRAEPDEGDGPASSGGGSG